MNWTTIREALYTWVSGQESYPVLWGNQDAPRPSGPFTTLRVTTRNKIGADYVTLPTEAGVVSIRGTREFILEIQTFGTEALARSDTIRSSLSRLSVQEALYRSGLSAVSEESIQNLTALDQDRWEERGSFDVRFRTAEEITDTPGLIEVVELEGIINKPDGTEAVHFGPEEIDFVED